MAVSYRTNPRMMVTLLHPTEDDVDAAHSRARRWQELADVAERRGRDATWPKMKAILWTVVAATVGDRYARAEM